MTKVKICCIQNKNEIDAVIGAGADAIGLVSAMPSGPGVITDKQISLLSEYASGRTEVFLLTSKISATEIIAQFHDFQPDALQLVDAVSRVDYLKIRKALPSTKLVQVIHVTGQSAVEEAGWYANLADAILLDSGNPRQRIKTLGGTGKAHDWKISRKIVEKVGIPVYLAGGLKPDNVREAIETVRPFGVDVCSGIRKQGLLDEGLMNRFLEEVRAAVK